MTEAVGRPTYGAAIAGHGWVKLSVGEAFVLIPATSATRLAEDLLRLARESTPPVEREIPQKFSDEQHQLGPGYVKPGGERF